MFQPDDLVIRASWNTHPGRHDQVAGRNPPPRVRQVDGMGPGDQPAGAGQASDRMQLQRYDIDQVLYRQHGFTGLRFPKWPCYWLKAQRTMLATEAGLCCEWPVFQQRQAKPTHGCLSIRIEN
ncbi:hypothetical protein D3C78_1593570 [compost metagenome]